MFSVVPPIENVKYFPSTQIILKKKLHAGTKINWLNMFVRLGIVIELP